MSIRVFISARVLLRKENLSFRFFLIWFLLLIANLYVCGAFIEPIVTLLEGMISSLYFEPNLNIFLSRLGILIIPVSLASFAPFFEIYVLS